MNKVRRIDVSILGQVCPACLLVALREINAHEEALRSGHAVLHIITDHRDATRTIPESATAMGYAVEVQKKDGKYEIRVAKST